MKTPLSMLTGFVLLAGLVAGCNSISSTPISRMESDELIGESNGDRTKHCAARPYKGIPITLRVPTHVDIAIKEKIRLSLDGETIHHVVMPNRHLFVESTPIYTAKVFTVDVKRPGGGTANYTLEFGGRTVDADNSQYFKKIKSRIVDETISDITQALNTITTGFQSSTDPDIKENDPSKNGVGEGVTPTKETPEYLVQVRTVAWKRFDIDADDFEQQLSVFVEQHMNGCHSCGDYQSPSYGSPGDAIHYGGVVETDTAPHAVEDVKTEYFGQ